MADTHGRVTRYDLILEDGSYVTGQPFPEGIPLVSVTGKAVRRALKIKGIYRVPYLGILLRNFWAKRGGALLHEIDPASQTGDSVQR